MGSVPGLRATSVKIGASLAVGLARHRCRVRDSRRVLAALVLHETKQRGVDLVVCGRDRTVWPSAPDVAVQVGDDAPGGFADGQAGAEVDAVTDVAVGYVSGALSGRDPGQCQRAGDDPRLEARYKLRVGGSSTARNIDALGKGGSRLRSTSLELALGKSGVSLPSART